MKRLLTFAALASSLASIATAASADEIAVAACKPNVARVIRSTKGDSAVVLALLGVRDWQCRLFKDGATIPLGLSPVMAITVRDDATR